MRDNRDNIRAWSLRVKSSSLYNRSSSNTLTSGHQELVHEDKDISSPSFCLLFLLNALEWKHALFDCWGALGGFGAIHPIYSFFLGAVISVFFSMDHDQINTKIKDTHHFYGIGINSIRCKSTVGLQFPIYGEYLMKRVSGVDVIQHSKSHYIYSEKVGWSCTPYKLLWRDKYTIYLWKYHHSFWVPQKSHKWLGKAFSKQYNW